MDVAVFDTKPYDCEYLSKACDGTQIQFRFFNHRLSSATVGSAANCSAICLFVNDCCDREVLRQLRDCDVKLIALRCAGYNQVDLEAAKEYGIKVVRVPAYSPHAVAEHTIALLLTLNRKLHRSYNRVREFNFSLKGLVGFDIYGKKVGIVGTGKIGRITAEIFRGFGAEVLAFDSVRSNLWASENQVTYVDLPELFRSCDIISLHVPLTADTKYLLNDSTLSMTKPGVVLLNTSRGKLIDTKALIRHLKSGHIGGVGLDVYEEEEGVFFEDLSGEILPDEELGRLLSFPNVLISAHQAFLTHEALSEIARVTVDNLRRFSAQSDFVAETQLA